MGLLAPRSAHVRSSAKPLINVSKNFRHMVLQSYLKASPPTFKKSYLMFRAPTTAHSRFFSPKISFLESFYYCYLGTNAKLRLPSCLLSGRKERGQGRKKERRRNSAHADGGPHSRLHTRDPPMAIRYPSGSYFHSIRFAKKYKVLAVREVMAKTSFSVEKYKGFEKYKGKFFPSRFSYFAYFKFF